MATLSIRFGEYAVVGPHIPTVYFTEAAPSTLSVYPAGGAKVGGGAGIVGDPLIMTGSGGALAAGAADTVFVEPLQYELYMLGGSLVSGEAVVNWNWTQHVPSGGAKLGGSYTDFLADWLPRQGGAVLYGAAEAAFFSSLVTASATISLPKLAAAGVLELQPSATNVLPLMKTSGQAYTIQTLSADITLPRMRSDASVIWAGMSANTLPRMRTNATVAVVERGAAAITLPALRTSATGSSAIIASASIVMPRMRAGSEAGGYVASAALVAPRLFTSAEATVSIVGTAAITLPALRLDGSVAVVSIGTSHNVLPVPRLDVSFLRGVAYATRVSVMNMNTAAVSEYDIPANSAAQFAGMTLFATPTGLFKFDPSVPVPALVEVALTAKENSTLKRPVMAAADGAFTDAADVTIRVGEDSWAYPLEIVGEGDREAKAKLGRGIKHSHFIFGVSAEAPFTLRRLTVNMADAVGRFVAK